MKQTKIMAALLAVILVVALCVTLCACNQQPEQEGIQENVTVIRPPMVLASVRRSVVRNGIEYPAVEITCRFEVAYDAGDDTIVEWTADWVEGTPLSSEPVSDYVTVERLPMTESYQRSALVTCLRPFRGSYIVITATADLSGYKAYCSVSYDGKPDTIIANGYDELYPEGGNGYVAISLDNVFHDVGEGYLSKVKVKELSWEGTFKGATRSINKTTGAITDTNVDYYDITSLKGGVSDYVTARVENGYLYYSLNQSLIGAYQRITNSTDKTTYSKYVISDVRVYVNITLSCEGATKIYQFAIQGTVDYIVLDDAEITF